MDQVPDVGSSPRPTRLLGPALAYLLPAAAFAPVAVLASSLRYFCASRPGPHLPGELALGLCFALPYGSVLLAFHWFGAPTGGARARVGLGAFLAGGLVALVAAGIDGGTFDAVDQFALGVGVLGGGPLAVAALVGWLFLELGHAVAGWVARR